MILPQSFYNQSAIKVAQALLGCFLVRQLPLLNKERADFGELPSGLSLRVEDSRTGVRYKIVETEAYNGPNDLASHASRGRTARNQVMFGAPGFIYVYFTYGMHYMLNIVTGEKNYPAAALIRAVEPQFVIARSFASRRSDEAISGQLVKTIKYIHPNLQTNGPAKLTKALSIDKSFNCLPIFTKKHGLWIEKGNKIKPTQIIKTTRLGVDYAGIYKNKKWRFYIKDNKFISKK